MTAHLRPHGDPLLLDEDIPRMSLWQSLRFTLASESPRMCELRLGLWATLFGALIACGGVLGRSTYAWLATCPVPVLASPLIALGLFQSHAVLSRSTPRRLWAARLQVVLSVVLAVGCTATAGFASPAWIMYTINVVMGVWCLWRLAPAAPPGATKREG